MKESKKYIKYFNENILIILTPIIILFLIGFLYILQTKTYFVEYSLFEVEYNDNNVEKQKIYADQVVNYLRNENIVNTLLINDSLINVYKVGPLAVQIEVRSKDQDDLNNSSKNINKFINDKYNIRKNWRYS